MKKKSSLLAFFIVIYSLSYFLLTSIFYLLSLSQGYEGLGLPMFGGGDDGVFYVEQAKNVANNEPAILTSIHVLIFGFIFKVVGTENIFILKLFNYIGNILLAVVSLLILRKAVGHEKGFGTSAIVLITVLLYYPSLLLNTNLSLYRDVWVCFYYLWSILLFANLFIVKSRWPFLINFILLLTSLSMLGGYRKYALMSFIIGSVFYLLFIGGKKSRLPFKRSLVTLVLVFSVAYTFLRNFTVPYIGLSFQNVLDYRQSALTLGGSQMGISLDQPNIVFFYLNYLYSWVSNVFGPLPWQINGGATLIVFITETILFILIFLFLIKRRKQFTKIDLLLMLHSIVWFMLISISNDNLGTAARLRMVGWIPLLILFSKYYGQRLEKRKIAKLQKSKIDNNESVIT